MSRDVEPIAVGSPRCVDAPTSRVAADVQGEEIWFESDDVRLRASPEVFATAMLPIAVMAGRRLEFASALDPVWMHNVPRVLRVWNEWWEYDPDLGRALDAKPAPYGAGPASTDVGLCFTLGVDSFHTLLRSDYTIDRLVVGLGYDVPLEHDRRIEEINRSLRAVEGATGATPIVISTNLRQHPLGAVMDWERGHGGAIAALGHACDEHLGELLISSSYPYFDDWPWGSHFRTDSGWSSARLRVTHLGNELRRMHKVAAIADEPVVQEHLRVCWENRADAGNCGHCEKCVRTMLVISRAGRLDRFPVFPGDDLVDRLNALPSVPETLVSVYVAVYPDLRTKAERKAVRRLIERSPQAVTGSRLRFVRRGFGAGSIGSTNSRRKRPV